MIAGVSSVVSYDVEPWTVGGGNPANVIKRRVLVVSRTVRIWSVG